MGLLDESKIRVDKIKYCIYTQYIHTCMKVLLHIKPKITNAGKNLLEKARLFYLWDWKVVEKLFSVVVFDILRVFIKNNLHIKQINI